MASFASKLGAKLSGASASIMNKLGGKKKAPEGPGQADLEDSNCAAIGSAEDKAARKASAQTEPAWEGAGRAPGVQIWRIEKFQVKAWPVTDYGSFYNGDSYIVLHTTKKPDEEDLDWDIYFWLGAETSQDEMGAAAYKTVELDQIFDDGAVQHRECSGYESNAFLKVFPKGIKIVNGGVESGFHHVEPEHYQPRLLRVRKQGKNVRAVQVPVARASMNQSDVFILDGGLKLWMWEGATASAFEKQKAGELVEQIQGDRNGHPTIKHGADAEFWALLGGEGPIAADATDDIPAAAVPPPCMYKLSEDTGAIAFTKVGDAPLAKAALEKDDVFIVDSGLDVYIWVGEGASSAEKLQAMPKAMSYLEAHGRPLHMPITRIVQGGETPSFTKVFASW